MNRDNNLASQSKWNNPFSMKVCNDDRELCVQKFKDYIQSKKEFIDSLHELKGKNLGCWCYPQKCHGDVLIELINKHCRDENTLSKFTNNENTLSKFTDDDFPKLG